MNPTRNRLEQMSRVLLATILLASLAGCELFDYEPTADFTWSPAPAYARVDVQFTDQSHDVSGMFKDGGSSAGSGGSEMAPNRGTSIQCTRTSSAERTTCCSLCRILSY